MESIEHVFITKILNIFLGTGVVGRGDWCSMDILRDYQCEKIDFIISLTSADKIIHQNYLTNLYYEFL